MILVKLHLIFTECGITVMRDLIHRGRDFFPIVQAAKVFVFNFT